MDPNQEAANTYNALVQDPAQIMGNHKLVAAEAQPGHDHDTGRPIIALYAQPPWKLVANKTFHTSRLNSAARFVANKMGGFTQDTDALVHGCLPPFQECTVRSDCRRKLAAYR